LSSQQPEPGCHYTAWSSVSTLIRKGLITKSSVPAKYALTDVGMEMAQKLVDVDSTCAQHLSQPQYLPASQETGEFLEKTMPRPWLHHQEDGNNELLPNKESISRKENSIPEKELLPGLPHSFPSHSIPSPSYSDFDNNDSKLLPGNCILSRFSQPNSIR